jgi:hypothetical protein
MTVATPSGVTVVLNFVVVFVVEIGVPVASVSSDRGSPRLRATTAIALAIVVAFLVIAVVVGLARSSTAARRRARLAQRVGLALKAVHQRIDLAGSGSGRGGLACVHQRGRKSTERRGTTQIRLFADQSARAT